MRTVRLRVSFEVEYDVPDDWDDDMVDFHFNESSFCTDTLLERRLEQTKALGCTCQSRVELVKPEAA